MKEIPKGSEDFRRKNPHLFPKSIPGKVEYGVWEFCKHIKPEKLRIRQRTKGPNKLEIEWLLAVDSVNPNYPRPRAQAVTFKLANGVNYTPDVFVTSWPYVGEPAMPTAWEVKGKRAWDDAIVKIKVAAHEWPEIRWFLVWKGPNTNWLEQRILP